MRLVHVWAPAIARRGGHATVSPISARNGSSISSRLFLDRIRPEEDRRYITEFFVLVPKKNGKSTLAAGIMVTAVLMCRRPEAEFMFLAPTLEVAGISFRQARGS